MWLTCKQVDWQLSKIGLSCRAYSISIFFCHVYSVHVAFAALYTFYNNSTLYKYIYMVWWRCGRIFAKTGRRSPTLSARSRPVAERRRSLDLSTVSNIIRECYVYIYATSRKLQSVTISSRDTFIVLPDFAVNVDRWFAFVLLVWLVCFVTRMCVRRLKCSRSFVAASASATSRARAPRLFCRRRKPRNLADDPEPTAAYRNIYSLCSIFSDQKKRLRW